MVDITMLPGNAGLRPGFDRGGDLFKVLAFPAQVAILATVARSEHEVCVCDFTSGLDLNQSTVSHHLKLLKDAGLINVRAPRHVGLLFPALDARVRLDAALASVLPVKVTAAKIIIHEPWVQQVGG